MRKLLMVLVIICCGCKDDAPGNNRIESIEEAEVKEPATVKHAKIFDRKVDSLLPLARSFVKANGYNQQVAFIADLSLHSGLPRFAVVDLQKDSVLHQDLVAHGRGQYLMTSKASFSNIPNTRLSSLGRYKIGNKYNGQFGKAYKLFGLDKTNSKAFDRFIVLHAYECVPDEQVYPGYLCCSDGCPMVSYKFLDTLSSYIDKSKKPILLWVVG